MFLIKYKDGSLKSHNTFTFQKITFDTCQAAPVTQSVSPELSPTAMVYSLLYFKSTQHFQNFSYVTWAHPAISWAITQYLNLGNILRRSPPWTRSWLLPFFGSKAQRLTEAVLVRCLVFKSPQRLAEGRSEYTMWRDLKGVFTTVAVESTTQPENTVDLHSVIASKRHII